MASKSIGRCYGFASAVERGAETPARRSRMPGGQMELRNRRKEGRSDFRQVSDDTIDRSGGGRFSAHAVNVSLPLDERE
jgi:hypothetical protein